MTDTTLTQRFMLERVDPSTWVIRDMRATDAAAPPIAHLTLNENEQVEVTWGVPVPLPVTFANLHDALDSLDEWAHRKRGATKPIPIPHFPPPPH